MTKKRNAASSPAEGEGDICTELKKFIVQENAKCVKEIKESSDRRLTALETSLSFAMDSIAAVSDRQRSADTDIVELRRETTELKRRLQRLELCEDHQEQQKRLSSLIFSGRELQAISRREDAAQMIQAVIQRYLNHGLDSKQVKAMIRLRTGKILVEFTTAATGSDRDFLFRNKAKLRGSGLFIAESLTPRRQEMFLELLRLKKEGRIFSVFTRAGNILICRSRDSAPLRVADPEVVRQLAEDGGARRPVQERPAPGSGDAPPASFPAEDMRRRIRSSEVLSPPENGAMEVEAFSLADSSGPSLRGSNSGLRRRGGADGPAPPGAACGPSGGRPASSLLDCAREAVRLVQLSPPLEQVPSESAAAGRPAGGGSPLAAVDGAHLGDRPDAACPPVAGGPELSLPGRSGTVPPPVTSPPEMLDARQEGSVGVRDSASPPGGRPVRVTGSQSTVGDASVGRDGNPKPHKGWEGSGSGAGGAVVSQAGDAQASFGAPRPGSGVSNRARVTYNSRDIREFF